MSSQPYPGLPRARSCAFRPSCARPPPREPHPLGVRSATSPRTPATAYAASPPGELHVFVVSYAKDHRDARFFVQLAEIFPDVIEPGAQIGDLTDSGRGDTAEMLRPFCLDYLRRHGIEAPDGAA